MSETQISINNLSKVYDNDFKALKDVSLKVKQGEILAMLGPNGAGKTSLISIICGIVKPSSGTVTIDNFDIIKDYRETRSRIGLEEGLTIPQIILIKLVFPAPLGPSIARISPCFTLRLTSLRALKPLS